MGYLTFRFIVAILAFSIGIAFSAVGGAFRSVIFITEELVSEASLEELPTDFTTVEESNPCGCAPDYGRGAVYPQEEQLILPHRRVDFGVLNGRAIFKPAPLYPPAARAVRASGPVVVEIMIDEQGCVLSARAVSGHPLLRMAAVGAARRACFTPTLLAGHPVRITGVLTYNFILE